MSEKLSYGNSLQFKPIKEDLYLFLTQYLKRNKIVYLYVSIVSGKPNEKINLLETRISNFVSKILEDSKFQDIASRRFGSQIRESKITETDIFSDLNLPENTKSFIESFIYDLGKLNESLRREKLDIYSRNNLIELSFKLDGELLNKVNVILEKYKILYDFIDENNNISKESNNNISKESNNKTTLGNLSLTPGLLEELDKVNKTEDFSKVKVNFVNTEDDVYFFMSKILNITESHITILRIFHSVFEVYNKNSKSKFIDIGKKLKDKYPQMGILINSDLTIICVDEFIELIKSRDIKNIESHIKFLELNKNLYEYDEFFIQLSRKKDSFSLDDFSFFISKSGSKFHNFLKNIRMLFPINSVNIDLKDYTVLFLGRKYPILFGKELLTSVNPKFDNKDLEINLLGFLYGEKGIEFHLVDELNKMDISLIHNDTKKPTYQKSILASDYHFSKNNPDFAKKIKSIKLELPNIDNKGDKTEIKKNKIKTDELSFTPGLLEALNGIKNINDFSKISTKLVNTEDDIYFLSSKVLEFSSNPDIYMNILGKFYDNFFRGKDLFKSAKFLIEKYPRLSFLVKYQVTIIIYFFFLNQKLDHYSLNSIIDSMDKNKDIYFEIILLNKLSTPNTFDYYSFIKILNTAKKENVKAFLKKVKPTFLLDNFTFNEDKTFVTFDRNNSGWYKLLHGDYISGNKVFKGVNIDFKNENLIKISDFKKDVLIGIFQGESGIELHGVAKNSNCDLSLYYKEMLINLNDKNTSFTINLDNIIFNNSGDIELHLLKNTFENFGLLELPHIDNQPKNYLQNVHGLINKEELDENDIEQLKNLRDLSYGRNTKTPTRIPYIGKHIDEILNVHWLINKEKLDENDIEQLENLRDLYCARANKKPSRIPFVAQKIENILSNNKKNKT